MNVLLACLYIWGIMAVIESLKKKNVIFIL